ncbi:MAG: SIS domain-containing protein [Planctomycetes bacterium]|nr:SIS domain-containing protein [Planctomycetota bacterium]
MDEPRIAQVYAAAELLVACLRDGGAVHICGNGGSAADAQHIAAELAGRFLRDRRALACSALTTNTSALTAIGNDYSYDAVFARQVEAVVRPGDVVWIISTSGGSPSVLAAAKAARARQAKVLGFTGGEGGAMPPLCDVCFIAPAETTYAIQQLHQIAYHAICDIVERTVCP